MGHENFERFPGASEENEENNHQESAVVEEGELGVEEKVVSEIPSDEAPGIDPELFQDVPEADLDLELEDEE